MSAILIDADTYYQRAFSDPLPLPDNAIMPSTAGKLSFQEKGHKPNFLPDRAFCADLLRATRQCYNAVDEV